MAHIPYSIPFAVNPLIGDKIDSPEENAYAGDNMALIPYLLPFAGNLLSRRQIDSSEENA